MNKHLQTQTLMGSENSGRVPMQLKSVLIFYATSTMHNGFTKPTSKVVLTKSVMNGYWQISLWIKPYSGNG